MRNLRVLLAVGVVYLGGARAADAQTAVPPRGEGAVSLTYQNYHHTGHFDRQGQKNTNGATQSQAIVAELDVGVAEAIGLTVTLPFIASKYTGPPFYLVEGILTTPGPLDDRTYHGGVQDIRVEGRRLFFAGPVAVAPFLGVSMPTHEYETVGEAVLGRHRSEIQFGASASAPLAPTVPRTYVHGRYAYAALERVNGFPHTRSNIDVEGGYDLTSRMSVRAVLGWQIAHKRPTLPQLLPNWKTHDRFINSSYLNVGGGASFSLTRAVEIYALWSGTVKGNRGAHVARVLSVGVSRTFGGRFQGLGS